eukprot:CAMPEP_0194527098 /NCGR_PEP_ID=MMETSP0253-20130528/63087_1 /TAXON_ID=2966 /ORGANISM="Noctiluca scintillans" /LENGTH=541 /DNA_ID=CAMNT_0039371987 /DNA_START=182 /DNA_END=1810 /DNA_ORIENTATION=-
MARGWEVRVAVHDEVAHQVPKDLPVASVGTLPWSWDEELEFRRTLFDPLPPLPPPGATEDEGEAEARKAEVSEKYFSGCQRSLLTGLNNTLHRLDRTAWPGLLVVDVSSVGAMDLAEILGLPFAVVAAWPVGPTLQAINDPTAFSHPYIPSELFAFPQSASDQSFVDRLKRTVSSTTLPMVMSFAGFHEPRRKLRAEFGLSSTLELLEVPLLQPKNERPLVIVLSHWGLDRSRPLLPNVKLVGPVEDYDGLIRNRKPLPDHVQSFLQESTDRVVYVSFGTNVKARPSMIRELLNGMAKLKPSGVRFLWDINSAVVETAAREVMDSEVERDEDQVGVEREGPHWLPSNVLIEERVDQLAVLASGRLAAFLSHCGINSVHEAAHFGIPIIGLPFLGDQLITAFLVEEAKAGARLSVTRFSADLLVGTVLKVAFDEEHRANMVRIGLLGRRAGGARAAADELESVAELGVGHLQTLADSQEGASRVWDVRAALAVLPFVSILVLVALFRSWSSVLQKTVERTQEEEPMAGTPAKAQRSGKKKRA